MHKFKGKHLIYNRFYCLPSLVCLLSLNEQRECVIKIEKENENEEWKGEERGHLGERPAK